MKTAMAAPVSLAVVLLLSVLGACGGNPPEPVAPAAAAPDAGPPPAPPTAAVDASASTEPASSTDAGTAPASKPVVIEAKDECTPVGVDFEKRARPKLKECYAVGKKQNPNLEGTVKIKITVDVKGKIKTVKVIEKTLPDPVADCMLKVLKSTPFPDVDKCWDATLTIPITFPTPK